MERPASWRTLGSGMGPIGKRVTSLTLYNGELIAGGQLHRRRRCRREQRSRALERLELAVDGHESRAETTTFGRGLAEPASGLPYGGGVLVFVSAWA